jgi:hypothetical protein
LKTGFSALLRAHEQAHLWLNAQKGEGIQEWGGPRSVSGGPIEETVMVKSSAIKTLPVAGWSGAGVSNLRKVAT